MIEGYWKYYLQKESVIAPFVERFKTATLTKSSKWIFLVLTATCLNLFNFANFLMIEEDNEQGTLRKDPVIAAFVEYSEK